MDEAKGSEIRRRAQGEKADALAAALEDLDPRMREWADGFIFGDVWAAEGLSFEERMLVAIALLGGSGQIPQLRNYLHGALQEGIPPEKVQETLVMTSVYAGFPAALNALDCWRRVRESHVARSDQGTG
ncbi:MAG TPA: carboxymuconolactone decarboxylase family protein [Solirubrobacterales bacterium]|nr:carboxymuconolactone decarboxylase family protein [Solirubrobacterales bacterium]